MVMLDRWIRTLLRRMTRWYRIKTNYSESSRHGKLEGVISWYAGHDSWWIRFWYLGMLSGDRGKIRIRAWNPIREWKIDKLTFRLMREIRNDMDDGDYYPHGIEWGNNLKYRYRRTPRWTRN